MGDKLVHLSINTGSTVTILSREMLNKVNKRLLEMAMEESTYASKTSKPKRNYCATSKELFAIVSYLIHLHHIYMARNTSLNRSQNFEVVTEHKEPQ